VLVLADGVDVAGGRTLEAGCRVIATARLRSAVRQLSCLAKGPVLGHVSDLVVVQRQHLMPLTVGLGVNGSPEKPHHHTVRHRPHDLGAPCHVWSDKPLKLLEGRPSLDRPVSNRRVTPPQMAVLQLSPLELRMEEFH
jgi:hypothetical protein